MHVAKPFVYGEILDFLYSLLWTHQLLQLVKQSIVWLGPFYLHLLILIMDK